MKPAELIAQCVEMKLNRPAHLLRHLANSLLPPDSELANGNRILDASDFRQWLHELANEADREMA